MKILYQTFKLFFLGLALAFSYNAGVQDAALSAPLFGVPKIDNYWLLCALSLGCIWVVKLNLKDKI
tara:strand:+ start:357 stop:554 length:198 start_codon:yes stop_codon:yes gene_type:complete